MLKKQKKKTNKTTNKNKKQKTIWIQKYNKEELNNKMFNKMTRTENNKKEAQDNIQEGLKDFNNQAVRTISNREHNLA